MTTYISREPCDGCDDNRMVDPESGFYGCARSYAGDRECHDYLKTRRVEEVLVPMALSMIRLIEDRAKRRELATYVGDGFANVLLMQEAPAVFDVTAFLRACEEDEKP